MLRDALKVELQKGQMKLVKGFAKTCYSEVLVSGHTAVADNEREDGSLIEAKGDDSESQYHAGLGLKFKYPGDPKKCVILRPSSLIIALTSSRLREASKVKLWTTYLKSNSSSLSVAPVTDLDPRPRTQSNSSTIPPMYSTRTGRPT